AAQDERRPADNDRRPADNGRRPAEGDRRPAEGERRPDEGLLVTGVVKQVDVEKGTITLSIRREGEGSNPTFNLKAKDIPVEAVGSRKATRLKLTDLAEGLLVTMSLTRGDTYVTAIRVQLPTLTAALKAVDADKRTLTLSGGERGGGED